jgi:cell shape-determining protein MreC
MKKLLPRKRNNVPLAYIGIGILGVVLLALAFSRAAVPEPVVEAGHAVARPVWSLQDNLSGAVFGAVAVLDSKQSLFEENNRLHDEVSRLRREAFATKLLREENRQLRRLLGRTYGEEGLAASVLVRPPITPYDTIVIDVGEAEGVHEGDVVVVEGGLAVGAVGKSLAHTATVALFSAPGRETQVLIQTASGTVPVLAEGLGGGGFEAHIARDAGIAAGDPVLLPLVEPVVFAEVEAVSADPADAVLKVLFRSPINVNALRFVKVVPGLEWRDLIDEESIEALSGTTTEVS